MKIRSSYTNKQWLVPKPSSSTEETNKGRDEAKEQIQRTLSEVIRCKNLVVLAGLGTSLCVVSSEDPTRRKASTMTDLWQRVKSMWEKEKESDEEAWESLLKIVRYPDQCENIEELLSQCKVAEIFLHGSEQQEVQKFIELAQHEICDAVNFLCADDKVPVHSIFLKKIARRSAGKNRAKIFTTNYDLCFECAAKEGRFVVIDGFSPTLPPTFDPVYFTYDIVRRQSDNDALAFIPNVFHLYKLHGSIDWELNAGRIEKKYNTDNPLLIYPRSSKYEQAFSQPYLEMMAALQAALREPNTGLLVVGFGFNDKHIAEPILSAIHSNLELKVVIVNPDIEKKKVDKETYLKNGAKEEELNEKGEFEYPGSSETNFFLKKITQLIDEDDKRLSLLNGTFEELTLEMPDMLAESELEQHLARRRSIEGMLA